VLSANAVVDRVVDAFQAQRADMQLIQSNLSNEQEAKLREAFGEVPVRHTDPRALGRRGACT
jgi:uncharacterized membrane protein